MVGCSIITTDLDPLASGEARLPASVRRALYRNLDPLASGEARPGQKSISSRPQYLDPLASGEARQARYAAYKQMIPFRSTSLRRG